MFFIGRSAFKFNPLALKLYYSLLLKIEKTYHTKKPNRYTRYNINLTPKQKGTQLKIN